MEKDKFLQAISNHLEDIREQFEIIRGYEGKIPSIELDLVMSNIRKVYEAFVKLEKLNQPVVSFSIEKEKDREAAAPPETPVEEKKEQPSPEKAVEETRPADPEPTAPPEERLEKEPEAPVAEQQQEKEVEKQVVAPVAEQHEEKEEPKPPVVEERPVAEAHPQEKTEKETPKQPKTTLDLFGESSSTLADRLTDNTEKRVADKLKVEKIKDIRGAIGINEKFLFINELFDGSLKSYEDAISRLNQCPSGTEAGQILDEFQANYRWDRDDPTTLTFMDLVRRRF